MAQVKADHDAAGVRLTAQPLHVQQLGAAVEHRGKQNQGHVRSHGRDDIVLIDRLAVPTGHGHQGVGGIEAPQPDLTDHGIAVGGEVQLVHQDLIAIFCRLPEGGDALVHIQRGAGADGDLLRAGADQPGQLFTDAVVV